MSASIQLGILETGRPPEEFKGRFGDYPSMFTQLIHSADPSIQCKAFAVLDGDIPEDPTVCDAWLITGSKFGVYEDHDWIKPLERLIQAAYLIEVPQVGICFGHQIIAQALGGKVAKSSRGWGLGVTNYPLIDTPSWMPEGRPEFRIQAYHQDQVVSLPPGARILSSTAFCPYAALTYDHRALTFQGHPEFEGLYTKKLLKLRRGGVLSESLVDSALLTVDADRDSATVAVWITRFLHDSLARRKPKE